MWNTVIEALDAYVDIRPRRLPAGPRGRWMAPSPDVWLIGGHEGPVATRAPVVSVVHGYAWPIEESFWSYITHAEGDPFIALTEATVACASGIIAPSSYTRAGLIAGGKVRADQVAVVPHGVDTGAFRPGLGGGRALVAERMGVERPYVLFASVPTIPQKNLATLRGAMTELVARGYPHALVVAGGSSTDAGADVLTELTGVPGRFVWFEHLPDDQLARLMGEADAFVLPSLLDSFGLTVLEALACGAPVVVSDRGALPEVVGSTGALVCPPTVDSVRATLERLLEDPQLGDRLRVEGRRRAEEMTWQHTAQGWAHTLERAAKRQSVSD